MNHWPRPMTIAEIKPPFKIVDVNKGWSRLYGYFCEEAVGSTLNELLQGPESNAAATNNRITLLLHQNNGNIDYEVVLVNSRSDERKPKNHVQVGCIKNKIRDTIHFVGLFIKLSDDALRNASHENICKCVAND